jgi:hypothetical protein
MHTKTIALQQLETRLVWILGATSVFLVIMYIYLVNSTVFNIMAVREGGDQISALSSEVSELESAYINQTATVDMTLAHSLGFNETKSTETAYAGTSQSGSLSLR